MLKTYHHLFRFNKDNNSDYLLSSFASYYNHVYHHAYALWAKQQSIIFSHQRTLTHQQLITNFYQHNLNINKNNKLKIPDFNFTLSSEHKKQIISTKYISSRQLNSIHFQLQGNLKSLYELKQLDLKQKLEKFNILNKDILLLKQKIKSQLVLLAYDKNHKQLLHETFIQYKIFKSISKNKNKKFIFNNDKNINDKKLNISESLVKVKYKLYNLIIKRNNLQPKINKLIIQFMTGKLPLCFGTKKLFHKQHNLPYYHNNYIYPKKKSGKINPKSNHKYYFDLWKQEFNETRNNSFYLVGAAAETSGNQSCQAIIQNNNKQENMINNKEQKSLINSHKKSLITLKVRLPDAVFLKNNPSLNNEIKNIKIGTDDNYIFLRDLDFGIYHDKLVQAINNNNSQDKTLHSNTNSLRTPIHFRFERNINKIKNKEGKIINSPKYGSWTISFQLEEKDKAIISNKNCGAIGIDLNQEHVSVVEINHKGNLVNHYDIPMKLSYFQDLYHSNPEMRNKNSITTLSSNQSAWLIEQIVIKLCNEAKEKAKPIIVEKLDFEYKKNTLSYENKNNAYTKKRNRQLNMFVYSKFKQALLARAKKEGIEVIQINPAYTSIIGLAKYQKIKGLSTHQAASYVIARKGLKFNEKIPSIVINNINEKPKNNVALKKENINFISFIYRGRVIESQLPVRNIGVSCRNNFSLLKDLSKNIKIAKDKLSKKLSLDKINQAQAG